MKDTWLIFNNKEMTDKNITEWSNQSEKIKSCKNLIRLG